MTEMLERAEIDAPFDEVRLGDELIEELAGRVPTARGDHGLTAADLKRADPSRGSARFVCRSAWQNSVKIASMSAESRSRSGAATHRS